MLVRGLSRCPHALSLSPPHALSLSPSLSLLHQEDAAGSVTLFGVLVICPANLLTFLRDSERFCLLRSNNIITSPPQVGYPYSLTTASPATVSSAVACTGDRTGANKPAHILSESGKII